MKSYILAACCLILTLSLVTEGQEMGREPSKRGWKSRGGWSLNSVGYNGGLNALKQFIRRRSAPVAAYDDNIAEETPASKYETDGVDIEGFETVDTLLRDFDLFLKLKEDGNFDDELVKCIMQRAEGELEF